MQFMMNIQLLLTITRGFIDNEPEPGDSLGLLLNRASLQSGRCQFASNITTKPSSIHSNRNIGKPWFVRFCGNFRQWVQIECTWFLWQFQNVETQNLNQALLRVTNCMNFHTFVSSMEIFVPMLIILGYEFCIFVVGPSLRYIF